ncbi:hypothetical protein NESM_000702300 [Novymonas esmeraldas]|uniref:CULT domain-containing protein n=1 Tax=Novymonas esmeraldas TaxID=1808958 RepID=A0AAW0EWR4_9TRYP
MSSSSPDSSTAAVGENITPTSSATIEVLLCDGCRCPVASARDVLKAEETVPTWKKHVYSYDVDLFMNGSAPLQAYSATNPSARRFDLLRVAPCVSVYAATPRHTAEDVHSTDDALHEKQEHHSAAATPPAAPSLVAPSFMKCESKVYSSEHSFFPGYAWCFSSCGNCGAFLGWGFASTSRLRSAQRRRRGAQARQGNSAGVESDTRGGAERAGDDDDHTPVLATAAAGDGNPPSASAETAVSSLSSSTTAPQPQPMTAGADGGGGGGDACEFRCTGVEPDFIGLIITQCTGSATYPVAAFLRDVECAAMRQRRRARIRALRRTLRLFLVQMRNGYDAYAILHEFQAIEHLLYTSPPPLPPSSTAASTSTSHGTLAILTDRDDDAVPARLHAVVEAARIAVARQSSSNTAAATGDHSISSSSSSNTATRDGNADD